VVGYCEHRNESLGSIKVLENSLVAKRLAASQRESVTYERTYSSNPQEAGVAAVPKSATRGAPSFRRGVLSERDCRNPAHEICMNIETPLDLTDNLQLPLDPLCKYKQCCHLFRNAGKYAMHIFFNDNETIRRDQ
jgi:hypothetical protein